MSLEELRTGDKESAASAKAQASEKKAALHTAIEHELHAEQEELVTMKEEELSFWKRNAKFCVMITTFLFFFVGCVWDVSEFHPTQICEFHPDLGDSYKTARRKKNTLCAYNSGFE